LLPPSCIETTKGAGGVTHPAMGIRQARILLEPVYPRGKHMLKGLLRGKRPPARRIEALEDRVSHLEGLLEGLQDAVHRESIRRNEEAARLQRRTVPREMARALSEDARKRGLE
jgi:hypothetical protein